MGFTEFYAFLLGFTGLKGDLVGFTGFHWFLLGFTGFYWVLLGLAKDAINHEMIYSFEGSPTFFLSPLERARRERIVWDSSWFRFFNFGKKKLFKK